MIKKIGSMATIPQRYQSLQKVLDQLSKQVDELYLYLNEYDEVPKFLSTYTNVYPLLGKNYLGDLNASGKMYFLNFLQEPCYCFTFDDDIIYPDNYISTLCNVLKSFNNRVAIGVHGRIIPDHATWYYELSTIFPGSHELNYQHMAVNLLGSGCFAYYSENLSLDFNSFLKETYVELNISLTALDQGLPLISVKRPKNWLKFIKYDGLFQRYSQCSITHHSRILQENDQWHLENVGRVWKNFLLNQVDKNWQQYSIDNELDSEMCYFAMGGSVPLNWRFSKHSMRKLVESLDLLYPD